MSDLNDYLDGRMDPEELEAFERKLDADPELSRRVKQAREMGEALREGDEELSPGFYTRTVAAFEEARRPRSKLPFGLTWSTAGLAVAGLAAAAIFLPPMLRDELPAPSVAAPEPAQTETAAPSEIRELEERIVEEKDAAEERADEAPPATPPVGMSDGDVALDAEDDSAGRRTPAPLQAVPESQLKKESAAAPKADEKTKRRQPAVVAKPAPVEITEPIDIEYDERSDAGQSTEGYAREKGEVESRDRPAPAPPGAGAAASEEPPLFGNMSLAESRGVAAMTLPDDHVEPGTVKVSGSLSGDDSYTVRGDDEERSRDRVDASGRFLILGRRAGLDSCGELTLRESPSHWEVTFDANGSAEGSVVCGILIPADGREIRFMGKRVRE